MKIGPQWTEQDYMFFASYEDHRAPHRPFECRKDAESCWVIHGPPALGKRNGHGTCRGCGASPLMAKFGAHYADRRRHHQNP